MKNVVIVPHLGSATVEVREEMANIVVDNILALLEGRRPPNIVNPEVLGSYDAVVPAKAGTSRRFRCPLPAAGVGSPLSRDDVRGEVHGPPHHRRHRQPVSVARSGQGRRWRSSIPTSACRRAHRPTTSSRSRATPTPCIVSYAQITGELLGGLTRCKVIGRTGLGVDNIDVPAAAARGITVTYVPDYCLREVSDHAMALLLALARKITLSNKLVQSGRWELPPIVPLRRLEGQVLGLIGFGNIPRAVAPKAKAFGLTVITHDPYVSKDVLASPASRA